MPSPLDKFPAAGVTGVRGSRSVPWQSAEPSGGVGVGVVLLEKVGLSN